MFETKLRDIEQLTNGIEISEAQRYAELLDFFISDVNLALADEKNINQLIGGLPLTVMYENHRNHAQFMSNVFLLKDGKVLSKMLPWVYRSYINRGFHKDYFPIAFQAWKTAIEKYAGVRALKNIQQIYSLLLDLHEDLLQNSASLATHVRNTANSAPSEQATNDHQWSNYEPMVREQLLLGDWRSIQNQLSMEEPSVSQLKRLYVDCIQAAMYEIGRMWEHGEISVAQEHLATATAARFMNILYEKIPLPAQSLGKVVITNAVNEFHELGGRMVADVLELEGWDVDFMGSNTPPEDLLSYLHKNRPDILGISVGMPFNLIHAKQLIQKVRQEHDFDSMKIAIGGRAFFYGEHVWQKLGADGYANSAKDASHYFESLLEG